jgi:hypothetical protein
MRDRASRRSGGEGVLDGTDLEGAASAGDADEFLDGPAGVVLDAAGDGEGAIGLFQSVRRHHHDPLT